MMILKSTENGVSEYMLFNDNFRTARTKNPLELSKLSADKNLIPLKMFLSMGFKIEHEISTWSDSILKNLYPEFLI